MKRSMISKSGTRGSKKQSPELNVGKMAPTRTVGEQESFYFYEAIGKPTGHVARSLSDFLDKVKMVKSESLIFHLKRGDFQNWVDKTLGDPVLAGKLADISCSKEDTIRTNICKAVKSHMRELSTLSQEISFTDNGTAISIRTHE